MAHADCGSRPNQSTMAAFPASNASRASCMISSPVE